jgi:hypothetical protein
MPSVIFDFHQNVTFLQNLVAEAGRPPNDDQHQHQQHHHRSKASSSNANRHYTIRHCLRHIQGLLARDDFVLPVISTSSSGVLGGEGANNFYASVLPDTSSTDEGHGDDDDDKAKIFSQVTGDLITLLTMDFEEAGDDPSIGQLVREAIMPGVMGLLETAPSLTPTQLHILLHHLLFLLETDSESSNGETREHNGVHLPLMELFNRHVTNHEHLHSVLNNDEELFVALHIALHYREVQYHHPSVQAPPPLALAVLINSLIEYWTFHCLTSGDGENGNDPDDTNDGPKDLNTWLQCQFLQQQQQTYPSPDMLRRDVDVYVGSVERYGTHLIESTLRLLEEASSNSSAGTTSLATSATRRNQDDEDDHDVIILKCK